MLEAVGKLGVTLNEWSFLRDHIGKGKFYQKCIFRHVNFLRDNKLENKLEAFLKEAIGKKYSANPRKLARQKSGVRPFEDGEEKIIENDRTFFCSELIAKAFKHLGIILNNDQSCAKFYPNHFSGKGDQFLKLTEGTSIDEE